jgi:hypothetical protein
MSLNLLSVPQHDRSARRYKICPYKVSNQKAPARRYVDARPMCSLQTGSPIHFRGVHHAIDEGNSEVMQKRLKKLEEALKTTEESNKALRTEVKALKQKPTPRPEPTLSDEDIYADETNMGGSDIDYDSDITRRTENGPMTFKSKMVSTRASVL